MVARKCKTAFPLAELGMPGPVLVCDTALRDTGSLESLGGVYARSASTSAQVPGHTAAARCMLSVLHGHTGRHLQGAWQRQVASGDAMRAARRSTWASRH